MIFVRVFAIEKRRRTGWAGKSKRISSKHYVSFAIQCQGAGTLLVLRPFSRFYIDSDFFAISFLLIKLERLWIWWRIHRSVWFCRWIVFRICPFRVKLDGCWNADAWKVDCLVKIVNFISSSNNTIATFSIALRGGPNSISKMISPWSFSRSVWTHPFFSMIIYQTWAYWQPTVCIFHKRVMLCWLTHCGIIWWNRRGRSQSDWSRCSPNSNVQPMKNHSLKLISIASSAFAYLLKIRLICVTFFLSKWFFNFVCIRTRPTNRYAVY